MTNGTIERKCMKGHKKAEGRCSPRCVRWYPRIQRATPDAHSRRRFDYLGGYPTKAAARAALHQALGRQGDNVAPDHPSKTSNTSVMGGPAQPTLNDLLDHWLSHLQANKAVRLRTVGRYRQLTEHHVRPDLGTLPLSALSTLQVQRLYDQLAHHGRKDGKAGGLGSRTIRQLHLCLHQALSYAMKWHDLATNPAADAEPPALPAHTPTLTPQQVGILLAAAHHERRPWLHAFVVLAAATGARTGELCGLEQHDLDLEAGTLRFRQALSSIDQQLASGRPRPNGRRGKLLVVGPLKTPASQAVLSLPAFAVDALRDHQQLQRQRTPLQLLLVQPGAGPPAGRARPVTAHRAGHGGSSRARQPGVPGLRPRCRGSGASPPATPFAGLGDGGGQGTRQRDRRAAAPRRRRHAGQ